MTKEKEDQMDQQNQELPEACEKANEPPHPPDDLTQDTPRLTKKFTHKRTTSIRGEGDLKNHPDNILPRI